MNNIDKGMGENCISCPRECGGDRSRGETGICGMDNSLNIASVCVHKGEEPVICGENGIFNIFFAGCNLNCIYCQNYDISRPETVIIDRNLDLNMLLDLIEEKVTRGIKSVGFVSPSHVIKQVKTILEGMNSRGLNPIKVYNTNSYDKLEAIRSLSGLIDVFLPDYKYVTPQMAAEYSGASDYPEIALRVLREMYYQKGSSLITDENGMAENGLLIRHLVLPGHTEESKKVLRTIAEELSPGVHVSLMSQYHPTPAVSRHPVLGRSLQKREYESVVETMEELGFRNGWIQDMDSHTNYRPDFSREHPFEA